ncbi:MAG TPA: hypothetical protein VG389_03285 [Myxococcota bacterium]|jgi:hypothetical protein|nr:hypothetical protein [Myxococcota bacterium]
MTTGRRAVFLASLALFGCTPLGMGPPGGARDGGAGGRPDGGGAPDAATPPPACDPAAGGVRWCDPAGDASGAAADMLEGVAMVQDGVVDLRLRFTAFPIVNMTTGWNSMEIWFDIDQDGMSDLGNPLLLNLVDGNVEMTYPDVVPDPCPQGGVDATTNTLQLLLDLDHLGGATRFNYSVNVCWTAMNAGGKCDSAPDGLLQVAGTTLSSGLGVLPAFDGQPLCP